MAMEKRISLFSMRVWIGAGQQVLDTARDLEESWDLLVLIEEIYALLTRSRSRS